MNLVSVVVVSMLVCAGAEAQVYVWKDPKYGTVQMDSAAPPWYQTGGGPRVQLFVNGVLVDDTISRERNVTVFVRKEVVVMNQQGRGDDASAALIRWRELSKLPNGGSTGDKQEAMAALKRYRELTNDNRPDHAIVASMAAQEAIVASGKAMQSGGIGGAYAANFYMNRAKALADIAAGNPSPPSPQKIIVQQPIAAPIQIESPPLVSARSPMPSNNYRLEDDVEAAARRGTRKAIRDCRNGIAC